jgi:hypothetical protein
MFVCWRVASECGAEQRGLAGHTEELQDEDRCLLLLNQSRKYKRDRIRVAIMARPFSMQDSGNNQHP